jgi:hypothetical protein
VRPGSAPPVRHPQKRHASHHGHRSKPQPKRSVPVPSVPSPPPAATPASTPPPPEHVPPGHGGEPPGQAKKHASVCVEALHVVTVGC